MLAKLEATPHVFQTMPREREMPAQIADVNRLTFKSALLIRSLAPFKIIIAFPLLA